MKASGEGAIRLLETLETPPKPLKPQKLLVDSFRMLRGLVGDEWRRRVTELAQSEDCKKLSDLNKVARMMEKEMWCSWHWVEANTHIHHDNRMPFPPATPATAPLMCLIHSFVAHATTNCLSSVAVPPVTCHMPFYGLSRLLCTSLYVPVSTCS